MGRFWQVAAFLLVGVLWVVLSQTVLAALFLLAILPTAVASGSIVLSVRFAIRDFRVVQLALALIVVIVSSFSLLVLKAMMLDGAWPTYLPYPAIAGAAVLVGVQSWIGRRRRATLAGQGDQP
jgi:hypothetical protein